MYFFGVVLWHIIHLVISFIQVLSQLSFPQKLEVVGVFRPLTWVVSREIKLINRGCLVLIMISFRDEGYYYYVVVGTNLLQILTNECKK